MNATAEQITVGSKVRCKNRSIDRDFGAGEVGYVTGFFRFSKYHPQEVIVQSERDAHNPTWWATFWLRDVELVD